jgi:hypothetical protein
MLDDARADRLLHWQIDEGALPEIARFVARVTRQNYPDLVIPFHARWRHFTVNGVDRWRAMFAALPKADRFEQLRRAFDFVIMSVLVDAGTGGGWSYTDAVTRRQIPSSEGLALASLDLYRMGAMNAPGGALEAKWLAALSPSGFQGAFQVQDDNPLGGVPGRVSLLNRLGQTCLARPEIFAVHGPARPGGLADAIAENTEGGVIAADTILELVLDALGPVWPSRAALNSIALGDSWVYAPWSGGAAPDTIVPVHKLSQWLTYSLIEPLQHAGIAVIDIGKLTGLAEYRNGGLFVDGGALRLKRAVDAQTAHAIDSTLVVEWRALTVALLDVLHPLVAVELGLPLPEFPLARMLEGGTWAAGRRIAKQMRPDGRPPIAIISDGTVF